MFLDWIEVQNRNLYLEFDRLYGDTEPAFDAKKENMTKQEKLQALIDDIKAVVRNHGVVLDKYAQEKGPTEYRLKLVREELDVDIEKIFPTIYHGPPRR